MLPAAAKSRPFRGSSRIVVSLTSPDKVEVVVSI